MDFIQNRIGSLANQLIQPRKYYYCSDALDNFLIAHPDIKCNQFQITNNRNKKLSVLLLRKSISDTCIVYAHGLGSNKNQVISLAKNLYQSQLNFHICSFDFSGSGRSEGQNTTYGLLEQDDVNSILLYLDSLRSYSKFVLWGRSMGGASIVLSQSRKLHKKVHCIVLDSPFSSFEKAAIEIVAKNFGLPEMVVGLLIQPLKEYFRVNLNSINPLSLNVSQAISTLHTRIMLIYSKQDSIIKYQHSKEIGKYCQRNPIELEIAEDHNRPRTKQTYGKAFQFITESIKMFQSRVRSRSKSRGIEVASKENINYNSYTRKSLCGSQNSTKKPLSRSKKPRQDTISSFPAKSQQLFHVHSTPNSAIIKSVFYESNLTMKNDLPKFQTTSKVKRQSLRVSMKYHRQNFKASTALFS